MSEPDPIGRDLSRQRAERRLPVSTACVLCGQRDPEVLTQPPTDKVPATLLELHHVAGRVNDGDLTVVLCLNCHRRISARMPFYGIDLEGDPDATSLDRLVGVLRGLALFLQQLAEALVLWADELSFWIVRGWAPGGREP